MLVPRLLILLILPVVLAGMGRAQEPQALPVERLIVETAAGATHFFDVEMARTPEEQARGLMFRTDLAPNAGMLFVFGEPAPRAFWMKNTLIPLDMLFINADGRIRTIIAEAEPETLDPRPSGGPVLAVLEIAGGRAEELGILVGDRVLHPAFDPE